MTVKTLKGGLMLKKVSIIAAVLLLFACSVKYTPKMVQHIRGSVFRATDTGYYTTELVMKPKQPLVGKNKAHLIVHNYEGADIAGLRIDVTPVLPSGNLVPDQKPEVKDAGRGLYIIDNIYFPEPGKWELRLKLYGEEMVDTVVLPLPEVKAMPMKKMK